MTPDAKAAKTKPLRLTVEQAAFIMRKAPRIRSRENGVEVYSVPSLQGEAVYRVANRPKNGVVECNCPAFQYGTGKPVCKHVELVRLYLGQPAKVDIVLEPWKGKDQVRFEYQADNGVWRIFTHQKVKETGEVEERIYEVPHKQVDAVNTMLLQLGADKGPIHTPDLWEHIIAQQLPDKGLTRDNFNGGRNRHWYFEFAYYPLKVLEYLGLIVYGSKTVEVVKRVEHVPTPEATT